MTFRGAPSHLDVLAADARSLAGMEPIRWPEQTQRQRRGHDWWPPDLYARRIPALHHSDAEEGRAAEDTYLWLHYTAAAWEWWVASLDPETGMAYGIVADGAPPGWAYTDLVRLEQLNLRADIIVERDLYWSAGPAEEVLNGYVR
jgi:hypothetical protein